MKRGVFRELKKLKTAAINFYMFFFLILACQNRSLERHPRTPEGIHPGMDLIRTVPRPFFVWPRVDLARPLSAFLAFLSLSKSVGFVSLAGKASLVSISDAILLL